MTITTTIRVVHKKPGEPAAIIQTSDSVEALQALVGGWLELLRRELPDGTEIDIWCNEEGLIRELPPNILLADEGCVIHGPIFIARARGEETIGLTELEAEACCRALNGHWPAAALSRP